MALRGLRLFGFAGTLFIYVIGIFLLSLVSVQNPQQRRPRPRIYGEVDPFQNRVLGFLVKRQPLQWCRELRYIDQDPIKTLDKPKIHPKLLMQTFPGHFVHSKNERTDTQSNSLGKDTNTIQNLQNTSKKSSSSSSSTLTTVPTLSSLPSPVGGAISSSKGLTALASFPGSGNTWLRYLLQQATGIYTGSIYKDYGLLKSGFPAENVYNSSVLVVKTHEWGPKAWSIFSKSVLLVRDPEKAILAEFNRQSGGHVGFASPDRYKRAKGRYWQQFVTKHLRAWEQMNLAWAKTFTGNVKIIFYDDLVENVEKNVREILNFIKFPIDEDLLACALIRREGIYQRKKRLMAFDPYSPAMHRMVRDKRDEIYAQLGRFMNNNNNNSNNLIGNNNNNNININNNDNDKSNVNVKNNRHHNNLDDNTKT